MPDDKSSSTPPPSKGRIFVRRLFSFVLLWSIILGAMFSGNDLLSDGVFLVIIILLAATGIMEFYGMAEKRGVQCFKYCGLIGGVLLMIGTFLNLTGKLGRHDSPARVNDFETSFLILFVLGLCVRQFVARNNTTGIVSIATTLFGLMYVPWLLNFIQKIYFFRDVDGRFYLLYFILITKFSDSGAYAVGSLIGRHKMNPRISPGKTWEGFAGAIVVSTGASLVFAHVAQAHVPALTPVHAVILGVVLSCSAVIGDLIESLFKREAGVKDSGKFFPGIGGMLDLLDSILFNAPLMYIYLRHVLTRP
jgi:phosphatidate cytidylyltransferase